MIIATIDFETYSEAGLEIKGNKKGLEAVGACVYSEHPSTDIISLSYSFGDIVHLWTPADPLPVDLFSHICSGGLVEAWNAAFERWIWANVAMRKYAFAQIHNDQWRCCMAKSRACSYPSSLKIASKLLKLKNEKFEGKLLINRFSVPDKKTGRRFISDDEHSLEFLAYNKQDVRSEMEASTVLPDLSPAELKFWQLDQTINSRGIGIDVPLLLAANKLLPQIYDKYNRLATELTGGKITSLFQTARIKEFCNSNGVNLQKVDKVHVSEILKSGTPPEPVRLMLEYREMVNSTPVKKIPSMLNQLASDGRIYDNFSYHGAHTGRFTGYGVQVQNLPQGDPKILERAIPLILGGDLDAIESEFGNAVKTLGACLRGFIKARDGYEFICSDYSSIEAVVLAAVAGEDWRIEVFRTHGMIYELSAARVFNIPVEEFVEYKKIHGHHHPARKKGKILELAFGYAGGIGAYRNISNDDISDTEIDTMKNYWRAYSPAIRQLWHGLQRCFTQAVYNENMEFKYRSITYNRIMDTISCTLPSGRKILYHSPRLINGQLSYSGVRSGKWVDGIKLHGGVLTENLIQAISRDVLMYAIYKLEQAGYPIVLHVHDEIMAEVPVGFGSIEEFEKIMSTLPRFCVYDDGKPWPIVAEGGWIGERFGKY